jgi:hypothetical protein
MGELISALKRTRDYVKKEDEGHVIELCHTHYRSDGAPDYEKDGEWIWYSGFRRVWVDFGRDMRGLDVTFYEGDREVGRTSFPLAHPNFPIESRVGEQILGFLAPLQA